MGNEQTLQFQLRQSSIMTKLLLKNEEQVIKHLEQQEIQLNRPINQMGDRIAHYAAYKSMYRLLSWLIQKDADFQNTFNHRRLSPIDVAEPQTREWIYKKVNQYKVIKARNSIKKKSSVKNTPNNSQSIIQEKSSQTLKRKLAENKDESFDNNVAENQEKPILQRAQTIEKRQQSSKKDSVDFANILFRQKS